MSGQGERAHYQAMDSCGRAWLRCLQLRGMIFVYERPDQRLFAGTACLDICLNECQCPYYLIITCALQMLPSKYSAPQTQEMSLIGLALDLASQDQLCIMMHLQPDWEHCTMQSEALEKISQVNCAPSFLFFEQLNVCLIKLDTSPWLFWPFSFENLAAFPMRHDYATKLLQ